MGLRLKILSILLGTLTALAVASVSYLRAEGTVAREIRERADVVRDMRRLLNALDTPLIQLDSILRSWAHWTEFYNYAYRPNPAFRKDELSTESLRLAQIDWMWLVDIQGRPIDMVERAQPQAASPVGGATPAMAAFDQLRDGLLSRFPELVASRAGQCGVVLIAGQFGLICLHLLLTSEGVGEPHAVVALGRWLTPAMLDAVRTQTDLNFVLRPSASTPARPAPDDALTDLFGSGTPELRPRGDVMEVRFPIVSITKQKIGDIEMAWPRLAYLQARQGMEDVLLFLLALIACCGLLMAAIIDRMVVGRIRRLQREVGAAASSGNWQQRITVTGRDEIAELARFTAGILAVVRQQMVELRTLSMTDTLTGLANRRHFDDRLQHVVGQAERHPGTATLILFDVDHFKHFNDIYGHPAGDAALQQVALWIGRGARRPGDLAARLGGEEFALLLEDTPLDGARQRADAILQMTRDAAVPHRGSATATVMTLSAGLAALRPDDSATTLYARADAALYAAKKGGRNRAGVAGEHVQLPSDGKDQPP